VSARNIYGYGEASQPVSILAAQEPYKPIPPTTTLELSNVIISWDLPNEMGSPITSYSIEVLHKDGVTYTPDLVLCDGLDANVVMNRKCVFPVSVLTEEPYSLTWADSVWARLTATNAYGTSAYSEAGNGAILYTIPDAPFNLVEEIEYRTVSTVGFSWDTAFYGGTPIIDFSVMSD